MATHKDFLMCVLSQKMLSKQRGESNLSPLKFFFINFFVFFVMYKTIKGVYGKNRLVDLETLEFYNVQLPTQIVGIFMLLIEDDKVIVVKYAIWRDSWNWWGISWEWVRKVSCLYGLV